MPNDSGLQSTVRALLEQADGKYKLNRLEEAEPLYRRVLELQPRLGGARCHYKFLASFKLAGVLRSRNRSAEAVQVFKQALDAKPKGASYDKAAAVICNNLGTFYKGANRLREAQALFERSLQLDPTAAVHTNLGNTLRQLGRLEEAARAYGQALLVDPGFDVAKLGFCIAQIPIIYTSADEIAASRARYETALQALSDEYAKASPAARVKAADLVGSIQPFYLAYQGGNDRHLQGLYGAMVCRLMADRYPHVRPNACGHRRREAKIRVGFVSRFFFSSHSVWKMPLKGWVENLDRKRFEVFGYGTKGVDEGSASARSELFSRFVQGNLSRERWCEEISKDALDVLIYPELGMDPVSPALASRRLAPLQMTSWGHPLTSGFPTIDYFLSSDLMEPPNGQDHYTETLARLPNLGVHYTPTDVVPDAVDRAAVGLEPGETFFFCCQSLYKYLPQHDDVFPRIAREVGRCRFVFIEDVREDGDLNLIFRQRLDAAFRAVGLKSEDHCIFRPHMSRSAFAGMCAAAEVFLDSIGWSGCNTALEATAQGLPIVTLPSDLMRGRHALAILTMMGVEETIATSKEDYVRIAVRLAREPGYRGRIAELVARNRHKLYRDEAPVRALEALIERELAPRRAAVTQH